MKITINIDKVETRYRQFDNNWVINVSASTENVSMGLNYTGRTLNRAKRRMIKHLPNDLLKEELRYLFAEN